MSIVFSNDNWLLQQVTEEHNFYRKSLWTDESQLTRDDFINFHNQHQYVMENTHVAFQRSFQQRFRLNVLAGVVGGDHMSLKKILVATFI